MQIRVKKKSDPNPTLEKHLDPDPKKLDPNLKKQKASSRFPSLLKIGSGQSQPGSGAFPRLNPDFDEKKWIDRIQKLMRIWSLQRETKHK